MRKVPVKNTYEAVCLSIDHAETIENPHLVGHAENEIRGPWGAFNHRKGKEAVIASFLPPGEKNHRIRVSGVARGSYLEFGAKIRQADNSWAKSRSLYLVEQRSEVWISLAPVTESEVPYIYDMFPASNPHLHVLEARLSMLESSVESLRRQVS